MFGGQSWSRTKLRWLTATRNNRYTNCPLCLFETAVGFEPTRVLLPPDLQSGTFSRSVMLSLFRKLLQRYNFFLDYKNFGAKIFIFLHTLKDSNPRCWFWRPEPEPLGQTCVLKRYPEKILFLCFYLPRVFVCYIYQSTFS